MKRITIKAIKQWGTPSVDISVIVFSPCIGINRDPDVDRRARKPPYRVTHIPTGAAICGPYPKAKAEAIAKILARDDSPWNFTTQDEFNQKRNVLTNIRRAALEEVGL